MKSKYIEFSSPYNVRVLESDIVWPQPGRLLIKTIVSAISSGTEMLVYRGQWPKNCVVDETISSLSDDFSYPIKYGYSSIGRVIAAGSGVDTSLVGKRVFSFNPHESLFVCGPADVIRIPDDIESEDASMLPNMETAVNLVMDGHPTIGERVCVFGLGVVGLLTVAVLSRVGLEHLATFDGLEQRRNLALELGADSVHDPSVCLADSNLGKPIDSANFRRWADLSLELSGNPLALNSAIEVTGFAGRIVIGSWYGSKHADINLGGYFHRSRINISSSQVSTISPEFLGRWTKKRRLDLAIDFLRKVRPSRLVTHRFNINEACLAYDTIDKKPHEIIQAIFVHED